MTERFGKSFRTVLDARERSNVSVDRSVDFNRANPIFHHGRTDDWRTDPNKSDKQRAPKSDVKIKTRSHSDYFLKTLGRLIVEQIAHERTRTSTGCPIRS